jgi:hypothetical protein
MKGEHNMSKTKITGILMLISAAIGVAIDALNGGGFDWAGNWAKLDTALAGAGLVFLRTAISKITGAVK